MITCEIYKDYIERYKQGTIVDVQLSDDRQWIRQINMGNPEVLQQIYEKYYLQLFTTALVLTGCPDLAEDCLQDVFVRLTERVTNLKVSRNLSGYLTSAMLNRARDVLRRTRRQASLTVEQLGYSPPVPTPIDQLVRDEQITALVWAIRQLPPDQYEVFVLHSQTRLSFRAIAVQQQVSLRAVRSRYRYATEKLRKLLQMEIVHGS
jgi:RNA polymerase sigma-70 factor (ECF subfamily)